MDFLFKIRGCGLHSGALCSPELTVFWSSGSKSGFILSVPDDFPQYVPTFVLYSSDVASVLFTLDSEPSVWFVQLSRLLFDFSLVSVPCSSRFWFL